MGCLGLQFKFSPNMTPKKTISLAQSIDWSSVVIIIPQFLRLWLDLNKICFIVLDSEKAYFP